jgi:type II secretion system protein N
MGLDAEISGFSKTIFFDFSADSLTLKNPADGAVLIKAENLSGRIDPFSLLLLKLHIPFQASAAGGLVTGSVRLGFSGSAVRARFEGLKIEEMPPLARYASHGFMHGQLSIKNGSGELEFIADQIRGAPLELNSANGVALLTGNQIEVKSLSLQGEKIYVRIKGPIRAGSYDLTAEVMPEEPSQYDALLANYQVSPGYYVVPLNGRFY